MSEKYSLVFYNDEIGITPCGCKQVELGCTCITRMDGPKCCYTAAEVKQRIANYYRGRAEQIDKLSIEEFMSDRGIYHYSRD